MTATDYRIEAFEDAEVWDRFVKAHPESSHYHLFGWKEVIESVYGHKPYYLAALETPADGMPVIRGILPLFHMKMRMTGDRLVSIPFFDVGGILGDNAIVEKSLLSAAIKLGRKLNVEYLELRHSFALSCLDHDDAAVGSLGETVEFEGYPVKILSYKVGLERELPGSSADLMASFKAKLRSQVRKPIKLGLNAAIEAGAGLDPFYRVFSHNMRDLGSPVHRRLLFEEALERFPDDIRFAVIYHGEKPVAGSVVIQYRDSLKNPWASSLRRFRYLDANMLLYWTMLSYACEQGCRRFDFGRSSPEAGTCKFKLQWGAQASPLFWYYVALRGEFKSPLKERLNYRLWKKLPVPITRFAGPFFRKQISL